MVAGFLSGLFESKADNAPKNAVARAVSNSRYGMYSHVAPNMQQWDLEQAITQSYERVIWVYRCIDAIASNSSGVEMVVREYNDVDGLLVQDDDLTKLLNRRPNIYETAQQFRYRLASQLLLSRRGAFVEVVRNNAGRAIELHILPNSSVNPIPDPKTFVSGYTVNTISQGIVELAADRVIWFRVKPHPTDVYAQMTPLVAAGLASDTDYLARVYNRTFLANDGRPGMLVAVQGQLGVEDADELRRRFAGGPSVAGQTTVIEADGLSVQDMSSSPRDVQWQEAVRGSKEDILLAFGVPESVLGNASGRTFDNADAEFEIFWSVTMQPFMDAMAAGYDILTIGGMDDNLLVAHNYDDVDVLQRKKRRDQDKAKEDVKAGLMSIDEYLEFIGREKYDVPGTRVLWIPQGVVPIGRNDEDTKAASELALVGTPPAPEEQQQIEQAQADPYGAIGQRNVWDQASARAWNLAGKQHAPLAIAPKGAPEKKTIRYERVVEFKESVHPYEATRAKYEAQIEGLLAAWSERQISTIIERLGGTKARKDTRFWEGGEGYIATKIVDILYVTDPDRWADMLADQLGSVIDEIMEQEALREARAMARSGLLDKLIADGVVPGTGRTPLDKILGTRNSAARRIELEAVGDKVRDMIRKSAINQSKMVGDLIRMREKEGASIDDIKKEVRGLVQGRSSWKRGLAVHATTTAMEGSRNTVAEKAGKHIQRVWQTMRDERVRTSHRDTQGQRRGATSPFRVGESLLMFPGDPTAPIHETANCRCWVQIKYRKN